MAVPVNTGSTGTPLGIPRYNEELEKLEIKLLLEAVYHKYGYDFRDYAYVSIRNKIWDRIRAEKLSTITGFMERVLHDEASMARFLFAVATKDTGMFSDASFYKTIRDQVIPKIKDNFFVRIWHCQCSTGEEVFSLAIMLEEEGIYDKCRIYVTNMDEAVLKRARQGIFDLEAVRQYGNSYKDAGGKAELVNYYSEQFGNAVFHPTLRKNIVFAQHNIVTDSSFNEFHLIVSRNVLIHFNGGLRDRVHKLFYDSLSTHGYLGLGSKDSLQFTAFADRYSEIDATDKIYMKVR